MKMNLLYKMISNIYDLLDVIYFRNYKRSPRKVVFDRINENEQVLDLCCGTATNAITIAKEKPTTKIIGIDLSNNMLKVARDKINKAGLKNIKLYQMDATQLKFKSKCFDKICISLILHELDEALATNVVMEAKRVLKDSGEIIITEWEPSQQFTKRLLFAPIRYLEPKSYHSFIKKDLFLYFEKHGLKIEKLEHCDYTKVLVLRKL